MTWARTTKEQIEGVALSGCRSTISRIASRANADPRYASSLRLGVLDLMYDLWPPGGPVPVVRYIAEVSADIESMPFDVLGTLADKLARYARRVRNEDPATCAASYVIGGWMRCRCLELQGEHMLRLPSMKLKSEHEQFLRDLLCEPRSAAA